MISETKEIFVAITAPKNLQMRELHIQCWRSDMSDNGATTDIEFRIIDNAQDPVAWLAEKTYQCWNDDGTEKIDKFHTKSELLKTEDEGGYKDLGFALTPLVKAPQPTTWTSCAERLPKFEMDVLFRLNAKARPIIAMLDEYKGCWYSDASVEYPFDESCNSWAPLPEDKQ